MNSDAQTPEELEMLFEDSLLLRDPKSLMALFADGAVLDIDGEASARGKDIVRLALATWDSDQTYVAAPQRVIQARDMALIVSKRGINVVRRNSSGIWQYVIVCQ
ncbi:MAG: hypothetical protein IAF02_15395 [Anaerolineae bacterium]|nr:hypothetical protein [Anaerolineae bacterium]